MKICLVGNPNTGKSSIFNLLTGLHVKTGNYAGVTVDKYQGHFLDSQKRKIEVLDLPGLYSLHTKTEDEKIVADVLLNPNNKDYPELIVAICDASNLRRNLLLFTQIADLGIPMLLALNMVDIARKKEIEINVDLLSQKLGVRVVDVSGKKSDGVKELKKAIESFYPVSTQNPTIDVQELAPQMIEDTQKLLQLDNSYRAFLFATEKRNLSFLTPKQKEALAYIEEKYNYDSTLCIKKEVMERYQFINDALYDCVKMPIKPEEVQLTNRIDKILTHKIWGYGIFLGVMFIVFQMLYSFADIPMNFIDNFFSGVIHWGHSVMGDGFLSRLIWDGLIAGLAGILIFIPQIAILFLFISLLEDSGYMTRVTFIFDKLLRKVGLSGRSVVHLIGGYACAIPSIIATRNIEDRRNRLITILVLPLVSCSARLPIYTIIIAMVVPKVQYFGVINLQGIVLMIIYLMSMVAAIFAAWVVQFFIKKKSQSFFILEFPTYKIPNFRKTALLVYGKVKTFVVEAGSIIMVISVILFFLTSFSMPGVFSKIEAKYTSPEYAHFSQSEKEKMIESEKLENSFAGMVGKGIEPLIEPLGFDWRIGIALLTSFAAREVFVGTMATLFRVDEDNEEGIVERLRNAVNADTGKPLFNLPTALSLLCFFAIAMQCMSTLAVTKKETQSWKWPMVQLVYLTIAAFLLSKITYEISFLFFS